MVILYVLRPDPTQQIDPRAVELWRIHGLVGPVLWGGLGMLSLMIFVITQGLSPLWMLAAAPVLLLYAIVNVFVAPGIRWRIWRYDLDDKELYLKRGLIIVRRTLIPLVRVQHVDTTQGPLSKYFGLSSVRVSTAASTHEIPALADEVADSLRDRISRLARTAREQL